ncbi:MAG: hypothetical protein IPO35_15110 [Uliginosibacterium sp.]|nr:hypothetical protein [Uliginosibacterium sp.]
MTIQYTADLDKRVHAAIAPLFATDMVLSQGHSDAALNATVTFVRRNGQIYALTCHHVLEAFRLEAIKRNHPLAPSVHFGRSILQFKTLHENVIRWTFRSCRDFPDPQIAKEAATLNRFNEVNATRPDIAIADVSPETWQMFNAARPMEPIDLDAWIEPPWSDLLPMWAAFGFPNGHKYLEGDKVVAPMPRITVELQSSSPQQREDFTLCSPLEREHGFGFSGISGGPVLAESGADQRFYFTGLVFEGMPSSVQPSGDAEAFLGPKDIFLLGYLLTPERFDSW